MQPDSNDSRTVKITADDFERLSNVAHDRLYQLLLTNQETKLLLGEEFENVAGRAPDDWGVKKGVVFAATASKERILAWSQDAKDRAAAFASAGRIEEGGDDAAAFAGLLRSVAGLEA